MDDLPPAPAFLRHLRDGRFMIQRSQSSDRHVFYPRVVAPGTGAADLEWIEPSGRGTVYSVTIQRNRPPTPDTSIALIDLEEGPRLLSRIEGVAPSDVRIGMAVRARVVADGEPMPYVVFEPAT